MADNVVLDPGVGGATVKTDDDGTAHWQYIKAAYGADNTQTRVTSANGLPVQNDSANAFVVDLGATDNAVLDAIQVAVEASQTALEILDNVVSGNEAQVDVVSSALPTGASTSANQSTIIGHVDGIETVLGTIDTDTGTIAAGYAAEGAALGSGVLLQGDDGTDRKNINVDPTTGDVQVDVTNTVTVDGSGVTQPISAALLPLPSGAATENTVGTIETNTDYGTVVGGGTEAAALRVTLANNSTGVLSVDDNGGSLTVDGTVTANLSATDNAVLDNIDTQTTPAASKYRNVDANAEAAIKGSAGILHWLHAMNMTAAVAYLHLYDATTASVTPGTTTPDFTFPIPTAGSTNGAGFNLPLGPNGQDFATAITLVVTTTIDGSAGDPGLNGVFVNAGYT